MPSPKRRAKTLRGPLTESEIRELLAGHPVSEFRTADAFLAGRARLIAEQESWEPLDWWMHGYEPDGTRIGAGLLGGEALRELAVEVLAGMGHDA